VYGSANMKCINVVVGFSLLPLKPDNENLVDVLEISGFDFSVLNVSIILIKILSFDFFVWGP